MLWGRFDFTSDLTWVEMQGTDQVSSQMQTKSESEIVRAESVVLGKDNGRQSTALFSTDAEAKAFRFRSSAPSVCSPRGHGFVSKVTVH